MIYVLIVGALIFAIAILIIVDTESKRRTQILQSIRTDVLAIRGDIQRIAHPVDPQNGEPAAKKKKTARAR